MIRQCTSSLNKRSTLIRRYHFRVTTTGRYNISSSSRASSFSFLSSAQSWPQQHQPIQTERTMIVTPLFPEQRQQQQYNHYPTMVGPSRPTTAQPLMDSLFPYDYGQQHRPTNPIFVNLSANNNNDKKSTIGDHSVIRRYMSSQTTTTTATTQSCNIVNSSHPSMTSPSDMEMDDNDGGGDDSNNNIIISNSHGTRTTTTTTTTSSSNTTHHHHHHEDDDGSYTNLPGSQTGGKKLAIVFTCTVCDTRSAKQFTDNAYRKGVVIVTCPGCNSKHLIADNLGFFEDRDDDDDGGWNIERAMSKLGQSVQVVTDDNVLEVSVEDWIGHDAVASVVESVDEPSSMGGREISTDNTIQQTVK